MKVFTFGIVSKGFIKSIFKIKHDSYLKGIQIHTPLLFKSLG